MNGKFNNKGFTLVEVIVVLAIMSIISLIAIPKYIGIKEEMRKEVCDINCSQLEKMYEMYLTMKNIEHSEEVFKEYLKEYDSKICPDDGEISYVDGKVRCSIHDDEDESINGQNEGVPFL